MAAILPWPADEAGWSDLARRVRDGAVLVFPTDTFYGLGCAASRAGAVGRVLRGKGRSVGRGCPVLAASEEQARAFVAGWPPEASRLSETFWPGPLTLVLRLRDGHGLGPGVDASGTLAVRVPALAAARELARRAGDLLLATSANPPGAPPPARPEQVEGDVLRQADLLIDGGPTPGGAPSTIVDLTGSEPAILRAGAVSAAAVAERLGRPVPGAPLV